jgi:hypothetical protein
VLEYQVGISGLDGHIDGAFEPRDSVFVPMLPDDVAVGSDLT